MKTLSALIVKDDGLIYAAEVPEEPSKPGSWAHQEFFTEYYEDLAKYDDKLASAKENAVLVSDQKQAEMIIVGDYMSRRPHDAWIGLQPGIYPIPDLQWEVKDVPIERDPSTFTYYEREAGRQLVTEFTKVAILL